MNNVQRLTIHRCERQAAMLQKASKIPMECLERKFEYEVGHKQMWNYI